MTATALAVDLPPMLEPFGDLALTVAGLLTVAVLAFTIPVWVASRRVVKVEAVAWADDVRGDPSATWAADRALRVLLASCEREHVVFPGLARVVVGLERIDVDLVTPTVAPPAPWSTSRDGRRWSAPVELVQLEALPPRRPEGLATVVALGSSAEGRVLVGLHALHGVLGIDGDRSARLAVACRIADQLATSPWSRSTAVLRVGVRDDEVAAGALLSLDDALDVVVTGASSGVLFLSEVPSASAWTALRSALERPENGWGVVLLARHDQVRWQLTARRDGTLVGDAVGELRWVDVALNGHDAVAVPAGLPRSAAEGAPSSPPVPSLPVAPGTAPAGRRRDTSRGGAARPGDAVPTR
ncbi:hypothetical protein IFT77_07110 [Frigoribacterium sp. CFBP 13729]|uniref:hypothetical protein n=1 Tax=Frigoribacterium sp. CFBP 13729 TaxID=2775293 RepID=UPI00177CDC91|nr:hypothetical protein [Frigoribacterium sp. CFBP 13729]MBD8610252.1 hypothetical protein [Frigoribacterium sp. CFBP 13729]